jgi:DNA repair exonuclease SbcCD ATPase subunit
MVNHSFDKEGFEQIKSTYERLKGKRDGLRDIHTQETGKLEQLRTSVEASERGIVILQHVAKETQRNLEAHISNLVTTALASVIPDSPEFETEIEIARNTTECRFYFNEFGERSRPTDAAGGGPLDIASFALRTSYWSLNKNRAVFVLDEPFKFVSPGLQSKVSEMLKMLSEKLGLQIIMVSHAEEINYSADKTFHVEKVGLESKVRVE